MTDERHDEADFDDPSFDAVRDLLASARVSEPVPAEVAARLEATLAELTGTEPTGTEPTGAEPTGAEPTAAEPVVALRARRRLAPRLLAAAAVVVVAGAGAVGLSQVNGSGSDDRTTSADSAVRSDAGGSASAPTTAAPPAPTLQETDGLTGLQLRRIAGVPVLTTADFARQAAQLEATTETFASRGNTSADEALPSAPSSLAGSSPAELRTTAKSALRCAGPTITGTTSYPVVLDGRPAVLVVHPPQGGGRLVEAWSCDGSRVLAFTTVPS